MEYEISFDCGSCRKEIAAPDRLAGCEVICPECGGTTKVPIPGLSEGLELGEFILIRKIGSGGMGEVWLSEQKTLGRKVALKLLHPQFSANERFIGRFLAEANLSGRLEHPNIIMAYSAGQVGEFYYLATSYINGIELNNRLKAEHRIAEREALKIAKSVADALRYAWNEHHMIHRDIKPANIMIDSHGNPKLMDFGISKIIDTENTAHSNDDICGTPEYISPEQAQGAGDIDFHSDIYSLGITLFQMISGILPFKGATVEETLKMHLSKPFPRQESFQSGISPQCYKLIEIMTAKDPRERHTAWDYVIADIDLVLEGKTPIGRVVGDHVEPGKIPASAPNAQIKMQVNHHPTPAELLQTHVKLRPRPVPQPPPKPPPGGTQKTLTAIPPRIQFKKKKKKNIYLYLGIALLLFLAITGALLLILLK